MACGSPATYEASPWLRQAFAAIRDLRPYRTLDARSTIFLPRPKRDA